MSANVVDAKLLINMFLAGARNLEANKDHINELNVFPVPDGDTGTNMTLTILSAAREISGFGDGSSMKEVCKAISSGSLRGARGNSGVILSQLIRGFGKVARGENELTVAVLADAFDRATGTAYKAVMAPKEGTILTVAKAVSTKARELADSGETDLEAFAAAVIAAGDEALARTPELLPVLKQAGVVDSGGAGLMCVLKGCLEAIQGKTVDPAFFSEEKKKAEPVKEEAPAEEARYLYTAKLTIHLKNKVNSRIESDLAGYINSLGEGIVCALGDDRIKINVQTNDPGMILQKATNYGDVAGVKIEHVRLDKKKDKGAGAPAAAEQAPAPAPAPAPQPEEAPMEHKEIGFIAVSVGEGIEEIFKSLGVDVVISGGQTMNPSTEDVLDAIGRVNADTIFVLPNNKNIVMAANQAASMTEDKNVIVIPTKTIPQGITAVINYTPEMDAEANRDNMLEEIARVHTAEITYAVRDTMIDGITIKEGDFMGIGDSGICFSGSDRDETILETMKKIAGEETEIISIYYGQDVTEEEAEAVREKLSAIFPSCDVEVQFGGQPVYYFILSAE